MIISRIIFYIGIFVWLLPPFRQKSTRYFIYFLLLAVSDPTFFLINWIHQINSPSYYLILSTLLLISLIRKKYALFLLIIPAGFIIYHANLDLQLINFLLHFSILLYFLKDLIVSTSEKSKIVIYNLILVMYEVSLMTKFAASYFFRAGYLFYDISSAFEILIAIFFVIYNDKNSPEIKIQMEPREIN